MKASRFLRLYGWWRSHQQSLEQLATATVAGGFAVLVLVLRLGFSLWELSLFGLAITPVAAVLLLIFGPLLASRH